MFFSKTTFSNEISVEDKVKAGYLYNFTKFIYWPTINSSTFNLCIVGADAEAFSHFIRPIEKKTALGKPIRLFYYSEIDDSLSQCQMIYFSRIDAIIKQFQTARFDGILTVGNQEEFIRQGGMLSFTVKDDRVKLQINPQAVKKRGLGISAKLLEVADIIEVAL